MQTIKPLLILIFFEVCVIFTNNSLLLSQKQFCLQSLESYNYNPCFRDIAIIKNQPIGVLVIAFNRPDYLTQVISSLEKNPESQFLPFYFFLDGGPYAKQQENVALINISTIKNKTIILRNRNYGCPKNHIDAKRFMFDWCGFKKVIILEDDLVVSPSFIHLNLKLHRWAQKKFSNIGVVQCWSYCYLNKEEKEINLNLVENSRDKWWSFVGYCLDKTVWEKMRPILYTYELFVDKIPQTEEYDGQRSKPGTSFVASDIRAWVKKLCSQYTPPKSSQGKEPFPTDISAWIVNRCSLDTFQPSQDIMTGFALLMAGYVKIRTVVNRAYHIGARGITCNRKKFKKVYKNMTLDDFSEQDFAIHDFIINTNLKG